MFDARLLAALDEADRAVREQRPQEALRALDRAGEAAGPVGRCLWLAARSLLLDERGEADESGRVLEQARAMEVPLRSVIDLVVERRLRDGAPMSAADRTYLLGESPDPGTVGDPVATARAFIYLPTAQARHHIPWVVAGMADWSTDLYTIGAIKDELVRWLGPEGAAVTWASATGGDAPSRARIRPIVSLVDHAREHGLTFEALNAASVVTMLPPRFFGQEVGPAYSVPSRSVFTCQVADAIVSGKSNIVLADDVALLDHQGDERSRIADDLVVDPTIVAERESQALVVEPTEPLRTMPEAAWLGGVHSWEFGHWAIELLPKLFAMTLRAGFVNVPIIVDRSMPDQHHESLRLLLGEERPIVTIQPGTSVRVERLWMASMYVCMPTGVQLDFAYGPGTLAFDPGAFLTLTAQGNRLSEHVAPAEGMPSIYLSRKPGQRRRMTNAPEVESLLIERGFVSHDFAEIPFERQLAIIRGAERIVAADGSTLAFLPFARPGTRVGILGLPYADNVEWPTTVSRLVGLDTYVLAGRVVNDFPGIRWFSDYEIDPSQLEHLLETLGVP